MIWGLPISFFAILMISVVASMLMVIFSFGILAIISTGLWNALLYIILTRMTTGTEIPRFKKVFPNCIRNNKLNISVYVDH